MKVIPPITITNSKFTSSTVAEPDLTAGRVEALWSAATNYTVGTRVIRATTHKTYENLIAGVDAGLPESTPARWLEVGSTNKWAMFDLYRNSQTVGVSPMKIVVSPQERVDSVAILGVSAQSALIEMKIGAVVQYTKTVNLSYRNTVSWYTYYFSKFSTKPSIILTDLPPLSGATIEITLSNGALGGDVKCGSCVIGTGVYLGSAALNAESEALNFSLVERDNQGNTNLVVRRSINKTTQQTLLPRANVSKVIETRTALNAVPAVWSGIDDSTNDCYEALLILGIYKQFTINLAYADSATVNIQLEEI